MPFRTRSTQLVGAALGNDPAVGQDDEVVTQSLDEVELMGAEEYRNTGTGDFGENGGHRIDGNRIQAGEGFVEDEGHWLTEQGRNDLDALLVAQREFGELVLGPIGQAEPLQVLHDLDAYSIRGVPLERSQVDQLVDDGLLEVQATFLGHVADLTAYSGGDGVAVPQHLPTGGFQDADHHSHRRRLACTVGPDETCHHCRTHRHRQLIDSSYLTK